MIQKKFLIFTVCIWAVIFLSENCTNTNTKVAEDMYRFLPKDILMLSSFDFQKLQKIKDFPEICSTWEKGINELFVESDLFELIKMSGIDFKEELDKAILFFGPPHQNEKIPNMGLVIKFKLNNDKLSIAINNFFNKKGGENYLGVTINSIFIKSSKETIGIALPDSNHLLVAPKVILKNMLDVYKGNMASVLSNKKIRPFIYSEKESQIIRYFALFDDLVEAISRKNPFGLSPTALESLSTSLDEKGGRIEITCYSEYEIKRFAQFLNSTKAMVSLMQPRNDEEKMMFSLLKSASIKENPHSLEIRFKMPGIMTMLNKMVYKNFFPGNRKSKQKSPMADL